MGDHLDDGPRVLIIDDDRSVLTALARLLRAHGYAVETFASPRAFLEQPPSEEVGCLVLDLSMPELSGLDVQQVIAHRGDEIPIVFLSGASDVPTTARAMRNGAVDFLVKPVDEAQLLGAVGRALELHAERRKRLQQRREAADRLSHLTRREREVCNLVGRGLMNKQIAFELGLAEKTVKVHRGRAMRKLHVDSVPALVRLLSVAEEPNAPPSHLAIGGKGGGEPGDVTRH
jgi:FixJ family two-component response regulator